MWLKKNVTAQNITKYPMPFLVMGKAIKDTKKELPTSKKFLRLVSGLWLLSILSGFFSFIPI